MIDPVIILILSILGIYAFCVILIHGSKKSKKYSLGLMMGVFIAWRTRRGKRMIERWSRRGTFWRWYGNISIGIVAGTAIIATFLMTWSGILSFSIPRESKPRPEMLLGLPGINPIIPIWYGILALAISIILHELAHAVLTRVAGVRLKSLGLLFFVVPVGAFCEPDEEGLLKAPRRKRSRVFAVGPATNLILALVCVLIFCVSMMGSLQPKVDGALVTGYTKDSEFSQFGKELGIVVTSVNGSAVKTGDDFFNAPAPPPGANVSVGIYFKGAQSTATMKSGVRVFYIYSGTPAEKAGLQKDMIIVKIGNATIRNGNDFSDAMGATRAYQRIDILTLQKKGSAWQQASIPGVFLDKKSNYSGSSADVNVGFLGVSAVYLGAYVSGVNALSDELAHPFGAGKSVGDYLTGIRFYIALPILRLSPFQSPLTDLYEPTGMWAAVPADAFWVTANILYWLFWLNLMLGLTNALPAVPFDGGYIFRDGMDSMLQRARPKMDPQKREKIVVGLSYAAGLYFLALIMAMFVATFI